MNGIVLIRVKRRLLQLMPVFILAAGLLVTWQLVQLIKLRDQARQEAEFSIRMDELVSGLEWRIEYHAQLLRGVAGLFSGSAPVTLAEFQQYVDGLHLEKKYPGVYALGYIPPEPVHSSGKKIPQSAKIVVIGSHDGSNISLLRHVIVSSPGVHEIMDEAERELSFSMLAVPVLSANERAMNRNNVLLFFPVVQRAVVEHSHFPVISKGMAFISLQIPELASEYLSREYSELSDFIRLQIDVAREDKIERVFDSCNLCYQSSETRMQVTRTKNIFGNNWKYILTALPDYPLVIASKEGYRIAWSGITISLMLSLITMLLNRSHVRNNRVLQQVRMVNRKLEQKETLLRAIYDSTSMAVLLVGLDGKIIYANHKAGDMFSRTPEELIHLDYFSLVVGEQREEAKLSSEALLQCNTPFYSCERCFIRGDNSLFWGRLSANMLRDVDGSASGIVVVIEDITARRQRDAEMRLASTVLDASPAGIMVTDPDCRIIRVNSVFVSMTGYTLDEITGKTPAVLASGEHGREFFEKMWRQIAENGRWEGEIINRHQDGHLLPEYLSISSVHDDTGRLTNYVGIFIDISERLKAQEKIQFLAHHDYLTGLPNRALLVERAEQAITLSKRYSRQLAIMFIDLNKFKPVNDVHGHNIGDQVLCLVAERLKSAVRSSDTVCRQGGDEFVILVPECSSYIGVQNLALKLKMALKEAYVIDGLVINLGVSIGFSIYPENGDTLDELIHYADEVMYQDKKK